MTREFTVVDLKEEHVGDVFSLCLKELGDYHSEEIFRKSMNNESGYYCKVALDGQQKVFGFSMFILLESESAVEYLNIPKSTQRDKLLALNRIGILDSAAIDVEGRKKGAGGIIIDESYNTLISIGADAICAVVWKDIHGVANAAKIVASLGLEEYLAMPGYWNTVVNNPGGHSCPVCGDPPCKCLGVLYVQFLTSDSHTQI